MNKITLLIIISVLGNTLLLAQNKFDITRFSDPKKYGWKEYEDRVQFRSDLFERQKLLQIYEMESQSIRSNVIKSAVIPGMGQFSTEHYTKGQVFLGTELILLGSSFYFYEKSMTQYKKYKNANQIEDINNFYEEAQRPYQYSLVMLSFAAVVWGYNLFDCIQSTESYNDGVWQKILDKYYQAPVKPTANGIQIRF